MMSDEEDEAGIKFHPEDVELIECYLKKKIKNEPCGDNGEYIVSKDVYAKEPWLLDHKNKDNFFEEDEWFYFVTRTQVSKLKTGRGKKSKRKIINGCGYWKARDAIKDIKDENGKIIGKKETLKFNKSNNNKKNNTSTCVPGSDSSWIMKEYMLWEGQEDMFQELVLCKIKEKKKFKKKDEAIATGDEGNIEEFTKSAPEQLIVSEKDHHVLPLACFTPGSSLQRQEGEGEDWLQDYHLDSSLIYNSPVTPWTNQEPVSASS